MVCSQISILDISKPKSNFEEKCFVCVQESCQCYGVVHLRRWKRVNLCKVEILFQLLFGFGMRFYTAAICWCHSGIFKDVTRSVCFSVSMKSAFIVSDEKLTCG